MKQRFPWDKRTYKQGHDPHDEAAYQGGNIGPDVEVPEPVSTLGVQLFRAKVRLEMARAWRRGKPHHPIDVELEDAVRAIDKALWHYDHDKLSDIGAQIIE